MIKIDYKKEKQNKLTETEKLEEDKRAEDGDFVRLSSVAFSCFQRLNASQQTRNLLFVLQGKWKMLAATIQNQNLQFHCG